METEEFHYPGEYSLDGIVFAGDTAKEDLVRIRDELQFYEDDIIVATYPKAGRTCTSDLDKTILSYIDGLVQYCSNSSSLAIFMSIEWFQMSSSFYHSH